MLVPSLCLVCRAPAPRDLLCGLCRAALPWLLTACARCGLPRCGPCPADGLAFDLAWSAMRHEGVARDLLLALKLRGALPAADLMAAQILERAPPGFRRGGADGAAAGRPEGARGAAARDGVAAPVLVVAVPGDPERARVRGFDVAARIARGVGRRGGWPVFDGLRRERAGGRQLGRGRGARRARAGTQSAMAVTRSVPAGAIGLLVDDVHTTGGTLDACARALRSAGFAQIVAATYVRTLTES